MLLLLFSRRCFSILSVALATAALVVGLYGSLNVSDFDLKGSHDNIGKLFIYECFSYVSVLLIFTHHSNPVRDLGVA